MRKLACAVVIFIATFSFAAMPEGMSVPTDKYQGLVVLEDPVYSWSAWVPKEEDEQNAGHWVSWHSLQLSKKVADFLPNHHFFVYTRQLDKSGSFTYVASSVSGGSGTYIIFMDYMNYRSDSVSVYADDDDKVGKVIGSRRIGVGLRISAYVVTKKAGVNLSGLFALGLAAEKKELEGSISVSVIGINSKDITNLIPMGAEINATSIQNALQALATIKSKIHDKDTILTPHIIAVIKSSQDATLQQLLK